MNVPNSQNSAELMAAVMQSLQQGERLLVGLSDESYTRNIPAAFNASIGAHYRHCLDHFRSLLDAAGQGDLNYDHRERGTIIEHDRFAALNATRELLKAFARLHPACLDRPLRVTCKTSLTAGASQISESTVGREVMYAVAHAVHHYALIGVMGFLMGLNLPAGFGVAPSTLEHEKESARQAA